MGFNVARQILAGVVLVAEAIQSQNFGIDDQGVVQGWQITAAGSATFTDVTVGGANYTIDDTGAASFRTLNVDEDITLGGESLNDELALIPTGLVGYGDSAMKNSTGAQWTVNTATISAGTIMVEFDVGPLFASRFYSIFMSFIAIQTVASDVFRYTYRYTVDGTTPTTSSAIMDGSEGEFGGNLRTRAYLNSIYTPSVDYDVVRIGLYLQRLTGTGTCSIELTNPNTMLQAACIDIGDQSIAVSGAALAQISKASGTPDPPPVSTYVKTYSATWSRSWNNGGGSIEATNGELGQGFISGSGNRLSWVGFDFSQIQSDLSGATVKKVEVYLYYWHWYLNAGGTAIIGTHSSTATSAPSYNGSLSNSNRKQVSGWAINSAKWVDITSAVGSDFKSGAATGIMIGPGPTTATTYYGKAYGNSQTNEPKLRITYTK